jgi:anthranilate phosphoribosyltransferase
MEQGVTRARQVIASGAGKAKLEQLVTVAHRLGAH